MPQWCQWNHAHKEHWWDFGKYTYRCPGLSETVRLEHVNIGVDYGESSEDNPSS
jgi:hypothetical protein